VRAPPTIVRLLSSHLKEITAVAAVLAVYIVLIGGDIDYAIKTFFKHVVALAAFLGLVAGGVLLYWRIRVRAWKRKRF
jgi:hypothetical protein